MRCVTRYLPTQHLRSAERRAAPFHLLNPIPSKSELTTAFVRPAQPRTLTMTNVTATPLTLRLPLATLVRGGRPARKKIPHPPDESLRVTPFPRPDWTFPYIAIRRRDPAALLGTHPPLSRTTPEQLRERFVIIHLYNTQVPPPVSSNVTFKHTIAASVGTGNAIIHVCYWPCVAAALAAREKEKEKRESGS